MRTLSLALAAAVALALATPVLADKEGKGHKNHKDKPAAEQSGGGKAGKAKKPKKFTSGEGDHIRAYYSAHPEHSQLPPGLAKQGKVPPGWQKKLAIGQRVPDDLWAIHVPLPHEVLVKLPPPPPGVIHVRIHDQVVKVIAETHELLDKIGLPHPPTPR